MSATFAHPHVICKCSQHSVAVSIDLPAIVETAHVCWLLLRRDSHRINNVQLNLGANVAASTVDVGVSSNGQQFSLSHFTYYPTPEVFSATPAHGPILGGSLVALLGSGVFDAGSNLRCRFDNDSDVPATYTAYPVSMGTSLLPARSILCQTPSRSAAATLNITVAFNGQVFTTSAAAFRMEPVVHISHLEPACGPVDGGTRLYLHGTGFEGGENATRFCRFGASGAAVAARLISSSQLLCVAPLGTHGQSVSIEVTTNAMDFAAVAPTNFTYHQAVVVSQLSPSSGPTEGGTLIDIAGAFTSVGTSFNCRFGADRPAVPASRASETTMRCRSHELPAGVHPVAVALNGVDYSSSIMEFIVFALPLLLRTSPNYGPVSGGTLIAIHGSGLEVNLLITVDILSDHSSSTY